MLSSAPVKRAAQFLAALTPSPRLDERQQAALEATLERMARDARQAFPGVQVEDDVYCAWLGERAGTVAGLAELHAQDLFLSCALARRDPRALQVFEDRYLANLGPALSRLTGPSALADDVKSHLRESLLVGTPGRAARIADYAGRGELLRWLKAAAVRAGLNLLGRHGKEQLEADPVFSALSLPAPDPELEALRTRHAGAFRQALRASMAALDPADRLLLRQYYADALGVVELGGLYKVTGSTISRRLARVRHALFTAVRAELAAHLSSADLTSLVRALKSQLTFTRGLFEPPKAE
jgi:RNA polymerase sigma-70 factor (ECF subfamily)